MAAFLSRVQPTATLPGGRLTVEGDGLLGAEPAVPRVTVGDSVAHVVSASRTSASLLAPAVVAGGVQPLRLSSVQGGRVLIHVGRVLATGLHQVDSPAIDSRGRIYVTYSGSRGEQAPVSVYRVGPGGIREAFVTGITNPTALAVGPDDCLYVSSRFDGTVYRVDEDGRSEAFATDLGVACGLAFGTDRTLFVGDRSGTVFRIPDGGEATVHASLPPSVAAFHLALSPDGTLYVTGPTLAPQDVVYRVSPSGDVRGLPMRFGRPQGLAIGPDGHLFVAEALAGASGIYCLRGDGEPELVVTGPDIIGLAFGADGGMVVATTDTLFAFDAGAIGGN